jgi:hypothetical protein
MLVAAEAQFTRKVSIGSHEPGSCGEDTTSLPSAKAGAVKAVVASRSAVAPALKMLSGDI